MIELLDDLRFLVETVGPRVAGTEQAQQSSEYIAGRLASLGLEARREPFRYVGWEYDAAPRLELLTPERRPLGCSPAAFSGATGGPIAGELRPDGYETVVAGSLEFRRIAVVKDGERAASLLVSPLGPSFPFPLVPSIFCEPTVYISRDEGRSLERSLEHGPVAVRLETSGRHVPGMTDTNVVATLPGQSRGVVAITCHYDSVWQSPGALDNASGVAVMLEVARRLSAEPRRSTCIEFIAFGAEEWWTFGSEYFVREAIRSDSLRRYERVINCDPLGPGAWLEIGVAPGRLRSDVERLTSRGGWLRDFDVRLRDPIDGSDHFPFARRGIATCSALFQPMPAEFHRPTDRLELVDEAALASLVDFTVALANIQP